MAGHKTFTIIKPEVVKTNYTGDILAKICKSDFKIRAMKMVKLTTDEAKEFYAVHKDRPFYNDLVQYMSSGPVVVAALGKENAVKDFRALIGATDPAKADLGTVRRLYGESVERNAIHGSDSDENAEREISFFFKKGEVFEY